MAYVHAQEVKDRGSRGGRRRVMAAAIGLAAITLLLAAGKIFNMSAPNISPPPGLEPLPGQLVRTLWNAYRSKPDGYRPRTHHLQADGTPKYINRLIQSQSPYLLQHAHNPVAWWPWGEAAFEAAKASGKPILLSVGYSTCHWCHVMERESFEDEEIAAVINAHFIPIKVDREERPDVDDVYMTAVQVLRGGGGWPMTVFLTHERKPFFAGTYFPPRDGDRGAAYGFLSILKRLSTVWTTDRAQLEREAARLTQAVQNATRPNPPTGVPGEEALVKAAGRLARIFDKEWGGFGQAPKFPRPSTYELLLRYHRRSGDAAALQMVTTSADRMSRGGMYDQLGGGFARYSTDRTWLVPHFEKMLYDNAQLAALLVEAWQVTGLAPLRRTLEETLAYVSREMTHPEGAFYSATDADSEGEEGRFFTWTQEEIVAALGPKRGERMARAFGVRREGHLDGRSVLHLPRPRQDVLRNEADWNEEGFDRDREALRIHREHRPHPILDDKILTEWNAQMISAFARAGFALGRAEWVERAVRATEFVDAHLSREGKLERSWRHGQVSGRAVLEDYAFLSAAYLDVFESTADLRWLKRAEATMSQTIEQFWDDEGGGFFATSTTGEALLVRDKPSYDGAQPSGNSVAALALLRLGAFTGDPTYRERADRTLLAFGAALAEGAVQNPKLALALDWRLDRPKEVVVVLGEDGGAAMLNVLRTTFLPNAVRVVGSESALKELQSSIPWLEGKALREGQTTAYVCLEGICKAPTVDPEIFKTQLAVEVAIDAPPLVLGSAR